MCRHEFCLVFVILLAGSGSCTRPEKGYDACHDMLDNDEDGLTDCQDSSCKTSPGVCLDIDQLRYLDHLREKLAGIEAGANDMSSFKKEIELWMAREEEFEKKLRRFSQPSPELLKKHFSDVEIDIVEQDGPGVAACALISSNPGRRMLQRKIGDLESFPLLLSPTKLAIEPGSWRLEIRFFSSPEDNEEFSKDDIEGWRRDPARGKKIRELEAEIGKYQKVITGGKLYPFAKKRLLVQQVETETLRAGSTLRAMRQAVRLLLTGPNPPATAGELIADDTARDLIRIRVDVQSASAYDEDEWNRRLTPVFGCSLTVAGERVRGYLVPAATSIFEAARQGDTERLASFLFEASDVNAFDSSGKAALHYAALSGNPEAIRMLIDKGADVHARTGKHIAPSCNPTPIFYATTREAAEILLRHGARVEVEQAEGWTPLHNAAILADAETLRWFLARGIDKDARNIRGFTPLHAASQTRGRSGSVRLLLAAGADVNARTRRGTSALHLAAYEGDVESVRLLLDHGANLDARNQHAETPLLFATGAEVTRLLIERGANPDSIDDWRRTALLGALIVKDKEKAEVLLTTSASVEARDKTGRTPMHFAAYFGNLEIAKRLREKGAAVDNPDDEGVTPLLDAIGRRHDDFATWLIEQGAKVGHKDQKGCSAIHLAAFRRDTHMADLLTKRGADPKSVSKTGVSPLHIAVFLGHRDTAAWLLDKGIGPDIRTQDGFVPLELAVFRTDETLVRLLISKGADSSKPSALHGTPLHFAAMWWPEGIPVLLEKKTIDVDIVDSEGNTPLYYAVVSKKKEAIDALLDKGADPNRRNHLGHTSIYVSAIVGDVLILQKLLAHGGKPNILDEASLSPLHCAVRMGHELAVKLLLQRGARVDRPAGTGWEQVLWPKQSGKKKKAQSMPLDKLPEVLHCAALASGAELQDQIQELTMKSFAQLLGLATFALDLVSKDVVWQEVSHLPRNKVTPLHLAALLGQDRICTLLISKGADADARTGSSETPLFLAAAEGRLKTVERLIELGANKNLADANGRKPVDVARDGKHIDVVRLLEK